MADDPLTHPDLQDPASPEERLQSSARMYEGAGNDTGLQLEAILHSVGAVMSLLRRDHDPAALVPIKYLYAALSRLAAGHADPVLRPLRKREQAGRPAPDGALKYKQVNVLIAVEVLLRARWAKGAAYGRVAELSSAAGFTSPDGKPISQHMIRHWRSLLSHDPNMRDVAEMVAARVDTLLDELDPTIAEQAVRQLLYAAASGFEGVEISKNPPLT